MTDSNSEITYGDMTDTRDNKTYVITTIGTQVWMAENLNYDEDVDSFCCGDESDNCNTYGRLYTWASAMAIDSTYNTTLWSGSDENHQGICPIGWHLPSDAEWTTLSNYVISEKSLFDDTEVGPFLKVKSRWNTWNGSDNSGNGTNEFGFSGLPANCSNTDEGLTVSGDYGFWLSSTEASSEYVWQRSLGYNFDDFFHDSRSKMGSYSVRCLMN